MTLLFEFALGLIAATCLYAVLAAVGAIRAPRTTTQQRTMHDRCAVYPDLDPVSYDAVDFWERRGGGIDD